MNKISQRIKKRRIELGLSQEELAFKTGYKSRSSINKIENDARNLTQTKIKIIAYMSIALLSYSDVLIQTPC